MRLTRFERLDQPIASGWVFLRRVLLRFLAALAVVMLLVILGAAVYLLVFPHASKGGDSIEALHSAAMILSGREPAVRDPDNICEKFFVDFSALFAALFLPLVLGLFVAPPVVHRIVHHAYRKPEDAEASALRPVSKREAG